MKKLITRLIVFILGFLGISGFLFAPQYGAPYMRYQLKGKVINKESKEPINNIEIEFRYGRFYEEVLDEKSDVILYTDKEGNWEILKDDYYYYKSKNISNTKLIVSDIDKEENGGLYNNTEIFVKYDKTLPKEGLTIELEKNKE